MNRKYPGRDPANSPGNRRPAGARECRDNSRRHKRPDSSRNFCLPESGSSTSDRLRLLGVCGLLVLAVGLVFGQTIGFDFVNLDDDRAIYENRLVTGEFNVKSVWAVFTQHHFESWTPLTCLSHMLVWHLLGHEPAVHHLTNVVLHAASAIVLFLVLRGMTGRLGPAHWSQRSSPWSAPHESVAWVTERKDVFSGLFCMLRSPPTPLTPADRFRSPAIWPC